MDIRVLNYFVTIAQEKNITRAAEKLLITQPTLSRQIKDLEEELGATLFRRSSRELQLTEEGQYLYNRAQEILSLVNKTQENLTRKGEIAGDLYIGAAESASLKLIAQACESMTSLYPQVRLHFRSGNADAVFEGLDQGILDFGIIFGSSVPQKYQALELPRQDRCSILVPQNHPLANKKTVSLADIATYPLIVSAQNDLDRSIFSELGDYRIVATYNLLYNAGLLVKAGVGIALGLDGILQDPELVTIPLDHQEESNLYLIWKARYDQTRTQQSFIEEVQVQLEKQKYDRKQKRG
ncbi:Hydrogen peroxide-inducible genes activator [Streptococcus constellatus]|uniref:Hydrogen peroxide-inducible genes activator n=1 Tax=Streptococcus constellatus TaxID=76860 RepID=A0A564TYQ9_STRCV|nr:LysR family transcriptional regulator [Streptococcus constellatus]VUX02914.1 Hydrogen peroxide-inducible genes activator [Streptococcus gordonii]VUX12360.1 Hydrogen peroxide-inducible genes activator [Streptococcus constellatus]